CPAQSGSDPQDAREYPVAPARANMVRPRHDSGVCRAGPPMRVSHHHGSSLSAEHIRTAPGRLSTLSLLDAAGATSEFRAFYGQYAFRGALGGNTGSEHVSQILPPPLPALQG